MSQHDMDIANQAGAPFRQDLNLALQALASLSSGAAAPATTFPFQLWADTANSWIWQRNAANTAWISIGQLGVPNLGLIMPGTVIYYASSTVPVGYLKCNGGAVSRTTYQGLYSAIGNTFGAGDGSTTFNLPELRGEFIRGWDDSRGVNAGRSFGSFEAEALKTHRHNIGTDPTSGGYQGGSGNGGGLFNNTSILQYLGSDSASFFQLYAKDAGGTETRPRNVAMLPCIKF